MPPNKPRQPTDFAGGNPEILLAGPAWGNGSLVFVRKGRLATFKGNTQTGEWAVVAEVAGITKVEPVSPE